MSPATRNSLLLFVIALVVWRFLDRGEESSEGGIPPLYQPDFIAEGLQSSAFDAQGRLTHKIRAARMEYFTELEMTTLAEPVLQAYPADGQALWQIAASEGILTDQNQVVLQKGVKIQNLGHNQYFSELETSQLELDLNTQQVSSDRLVTIKGPQYDLQGNGMQGDLNSQTLTLLDKVHAVYQSTQR